MKKICIICFMAVIFLLSACQFSLLPSSEETETIDFGTVNAPKNLLYIKDLGAKLSANESLEGRFYITGEVLNISYDYNCVLLLTDGTLTLNVIDLKDKNGRSFSQSYKANIAINDKLVISGFVAKDEDDLYIRSGRLETNSGQDLVEPTPTIDYDTPISFPNVDSSYRNPLSIAKAVELTGYLKDGETSPKAYYFKGYVLLDSESEIGVFILSDDGYELIVSSVMNNEEIELKENDEIIILAYLTIDNGVKMFTNAKIINPADDTEQIITLLTMNDIHGFIMQNKNGGNGLSNMSYRINEIRKESSTDNVLLVANGDMFQGTNIVKASYGEVLIDAMSVMGFDACGIGNHEFDWGLEVILKYFDGDKSNGEASFPLLNANIIDKRTGKLVSIENGNIFDSVIVDKAGLKVGIIGYIGAVKNSINQELVQNYEFDTDFASSVAKIGAQLKDNGADMIIVSIHGGNSDDILSYAPNQALAQLKYNNQYLVDAVINGHTHTHQSGLVSRNDGAAMPVIQTAGNKNNYMVETGRIDLVYNKDLGYVTAASINFENVGSSGTNYDEKVQNIINTYYERDKDVIEEVYCKSSSGIGRYDTNTPIWISNVVNSAMGTDIFICNTGGIRTSIPAGNINAANLYEFNPFDNKIVLHKALKTQIESFLDDNGDYYFYGKAHDYDNSSTINVAVIDYVYNSTYYQKIRSSATDITETDYIMRDVLAMDLALRDDFNIYGDVSAKIGYLLTAKNVLKVNLIVALIDDKKYF